MFFWIATDRQWLAYALVSVGISIMAGASAIGAFKAATGQRTLFITLVGVSGSGKTVFLAVLFHILRWFKTSGMTFVPDGEETTTLITGIITELARRRWPSPTPSGMVFPFRADVRYSSGVHARSFKIFMPDYAGDESEEFLDPGQEQLIHLSPFFKQVVESNAVLLAADGEILAGNDTAAITAHVANLMAAMTRLNNIRKGRNGKIPIPVCLLIMKADVFGEQGVPAKVFGQEYLAPLLEQCHSTCDRFHEFAVSSVGKVYNDGLPPAFLKPRDIVKPLVWILEQLSKLPESVYSYRESSIVIEAPSLDKNPFRERGD